MDSIHLRTLRMVPARPQDVLPYLKGTGGEAQGGHAEYMLMNADATYLIPDKVSYEQAAPISAPGIPFIAGSAGPIRSRHERVAVLGIGGLGHLAVHTRRLRARDHRDFALPR